VIGYDWCIAFDTSPFIFWQRSRSSHRSLRSDGYFRVVRKLFAYSLIHPDYWTLANWDASGETIPNI
jgi:hypothetical protein